MPFEILKHILQIQFFHMLNVNSIQFPDNLEPVKPDLVYKKSSQLNIPLPDTITLLNYLGKNGDRRKPSRFRISKYHKPNRKFKFVQNDEENPRHRYTI